MDLWDKLRKKASDASLDLDQMCFGQSPVISPGLTLDRIGWGIDHETLALLLELADSLQLKRQIEALFSAEWVNRSEGKPALHWALRSPEHTSCWVNDHNIMLDVVSTRANMQVISEAIRSGHWLGYSGQPIKDIVNVGIGGSQLGALFCLKALKEYTSPSLGYHFLSDLDAREFEWVTDKLNPETTLFIVASKSFTTLEALNHLNKAVHWINHPQVWSKHMIAVTANTERARALGFHRILPIWDWVGGRYSVCSAINLITCIAIGFKAFTALLQGAHAMDQHVQDSPFSENSPVLLALLGIFHRNVLAIAHRLVLTYGIHLDCFLHYVQQLEMESNGKSTDWQGQALADPGSPIIWGGSACQAQHSYCQWVLQSRQPIAAELILAESDPSHLIYRLHAAQTQTLLQTERVLSFTTVRLDEISPYTVGALMALYEHKVYAQSVLWRTNAFDQPAVEQVKQRLRESGYG